MVHERNAVRPDNLKPRRKLTARFFADPVHLIGNLSSETFFRNISGVVPKSPSIKIAEYDLLFFHR